MSLWSINQSRGLMKIWDQCSFSLDLSHSEPRGSRNPFCGYLPSSGTHWDKYNQQLAEFPHWFPDLWSEGNYGGKGQLEATITASTWENSKSKPILLPGGMAEISVITKDLKDIEQ